MPETGGVNAQNVYVITGYPDNLGGNPLLTAVANSFTIYCTPTVGINRGAFIEGLNIPAGAFVDLIYADRFTISEQTTGQINGIATGGDTPVILWPPVDPNNPTQTCAGVPDLYERQYNFTDFSTNTPTAQQPGNKLDLELNTLGDIVNHIRCRLSQIQRDDGFLRTEMIGLTTILDQITQARENALIVINNVAAGYDQFYATSEQNISNKLVLAQDAAVSAAASASSAQLMSSSASVAAMNATTARNQTILALEECQDILEQILAPTGPLSTTQANATQAQQSAQAASQSEAATQGYRSEVQAWHQAIQSFLVQANAAKSSAQQSANSATTSASATSAWAGQASDSATSASVSAAQASASAAQALAHSLNYIPGPQGPQGIQGIQGDPGQQGSDGNAWIYQGEYDNGVTYNTNDYVTFYGSSYVLKNFIGGAGYDPIGYPGSWQLVAQKGDTGANGADGATGQGIVNWEGEWNGGAYYNTGDVVSRYGSSYVSNFQGSGAGNQGNPPESTPIYWTLVAQAGSQGIQGDTGPQGPQGDPGPDASVTYSNVTSALGFTPANKNGDTFSGKVSFSPVSGVAGLNVGIGGTSGNSVVPGDMWITAGGNNLNFRDATGAIKVVAALSNGNVFSAVQTVDVTSTSPALRVTQRGTGNALIVEDSAHVDVSALVVDSYGNVGIGVYSAFSATAKLEVAGHTKSTTISTGSGPTISLNSTDEHTGGSDTLDLLITIDGVQYRIGLRPA